MTNPEFRRNLWIQFTGTRVMVGALIVGLLLISSLAIDVALTQRNFVPDITAFVARWLAIAILLFWAGHNAAGAVLREIRGRTWDAQRLSTLHPWAMAWGKLFGATSLPWVAALICAVAYLVSDLLVGGPGRTPGTVIAVVFGVLGYGLVCQATGMLGSMARLSGRPGERGGGTTLAHAFGLVATGILAAYIYWAIENEGRWFGFEIGTRALRLITIWFFALWAVVGVYRRMRRELQMRSTPWAWLLFLATFVVYGEGLAYGRGQAEIALALPAGLVAVMLWAVTLIEAKDPLSLRQSLQRFGHGYWRDGATLVPLWLVTYIVFVIVAGVSIVLASGGGAIHIPGQPQAEVLLMLVGMLLFLTRDVLIVQILALGREANLAGISGAVIWFVSYFAIPAVLIAGQQQHLLGLTVPTGQGGWLIAVLPAAVQAAICVVLFAVRWRAYWHENAAKAPAA
jgi:hypothetical protein